MTFEEFLQSVETDSQPPEELSEELKALWLTKKGRWESAHGVAQDINTPMGSWIHAHLHLIEGDTGNAGYWYSRAGKPANRRENLSQEWEELVKAAMDDA